jgi:hypothetical protein
MIGLTASMLVLTVSKLICSVKHIEINPNSKTYHSDAFHEIFVTNYELSDSLQRFLKCERPNNRDNEFY